MAAKMSQKADAGDDFWGGTVCKRPLLTASRTDPSAPAIGDPSFFSAMLQKLTVKSRGEQFSSRDLQGAPKDEAR
jgi:hypothetical protein